MVNMRPAYYLYKCLSKMALEIEVIVLFLCTWTPTALSIMVGSSAPITKSFRRQPYLRRLNYFFQLVLRNTIHTEENLPKKGWNVSLGCCPCRGNNESVGPLFVSCPFAHSIWKTLKAQLKTTGWLKNLHDIWTIFRKENFDFSVRPVMDQLMAAIYLEIQREHNSRMFLKRFGPLCIVVQNWDHIHALLRLDCAMNPYGSGFIPWLIIQKLVVAFF